ncbi:hypothetical protein BDV97DRAFT_371151 [Delphinella strobiligena]|nr:hypothetical protein BDV97DRAFT_371151 [Delphinella strobiligena]
MAFTKKTTAAAAAAATANPPRRSGRLAKKRAKAAKTPKSTRKPRRRPKTGTKTGPKASRKIKNFKAVRDTHSDEGWDYKKQRVLNPDQVQDLKYLVWQFGAPHEEEDQMAVLATLSRAVAGGEVTLYELDSMCWAFQAGVSTLKHMMHEIKRSVA